MCLNFVFIPSIFVINNKVTKSIIVLENWYQGLQNVLGRYNPVEPVLEDGLEPNPGNPAQRRISTISGNFSTDRQQRLEEFSMSNVSSNAGNKSEVLEHHERDVQPFVENQGTSDEEDAESQPIQVLPKIVISHFNSTTELLESNTEIGNNVDIPGLCLEN